MGCFLQSRMPELPHKLPLIFGCKYTPEFSFFNNLSFILLTYFFNSDLPDERSRFHIWLDGGKCGIDITLQNISL